MSETLEQQAVEAGIDLGYHDINGIYHATKPEVLESIVAVLDKSKPDSDGLYLNTMVAHENGEESLQMPSEFHGAEAVVLSDEADECQSLTLYPGDNDTLWIKLPRLACGYYTLSAETGGKCFLVRLIVAPESVYQPKLLANGGRMNGLIMHLYSLRSERNWGIGDFTDLLNLMKYAAEKKLDFVGINPLHALFTSKPAFASPYSPSSREWLNPIYLDIEKVGAFTYNEQLKNWLAQPKIRQRIAALRVTETVTYTAVWACKRDALHMAFNAFEQDTCEAAANERAAFEAFVTGKGKALQGFGLFEALDQYYSRPGQVGWQSWPSEFHQPDGEAVEKFARGHEREIRFYMWLQWLCAEQLQEVNKAAAEYGVKLSIYGDLAVGVACGSADTWLNRQDYCMDVSVGAPPDPLGPTGQNWNLPPLNPSMLKHTGYEKFAHLLRENMRLYGVLRIDHVMALCRLWWVLNDKTADFGAYVHYDAEVTFAILALESQRNRYVIIGEDLGTVPDQARYLLNRYQVFSYKVMCRKTLRCLHHRLRKISLQDLKRRIAVQTTVRLHSVIEINKAAQLLLPMFRTVKRLFLMPYLHQGTDNPFRLTVGLRTGNPGKLLTNPVLITGHTESMVGRAFVFRTVIGVNALNQVWAGINQVSSQKLGGTICSFVRQNGGV